MNWNWILFVIVAAAICAVYARAKAAQLDREEEDKVAGRHYGTASWYGEGYRGKTMANGQPFNPDAITCAAWEWPLGTELRVENLSNDTFVIVVVTDRGPDRRLRRLLDLSQAAFKRIGDPKAGLIEVRAEPHKRQGEN